MLLWSPYDIFAPSRNSLGLAGCNYKYPVRPPQGEKEKARRRKQMEKGMLK